MPTSNAKVGIIGLGVMGSNYARNLASKGIKTAVYNRTTEVTEKFIQTYGNEQLISSTSLEELISKLEKPRKIILLVKAGAAVDAVISSLIPLLDKNDIIIDFGNSNFKNTEKRSQEVQTKNIQYWGCGISGGEEGALNGPSLMPGGPQESWEEIKPILEASAAKDFKGNPCVTYLGHGSAGNYVKMVHNGIEYGIMQIMAEAYELMKTELDMNPLEISETFNEFNKQELNGYLFELASKVLKKKDEVDPTKESYLIDKIQDKAAQKGTGGWTAIDGLERGIAVPTITQAVISRIISSQKKSRERLSELYEKKSTTPNKTDRSKAINSLKNALYSAVILSFAQGLELIQEASNEKNWNTNLAEVVRIWQGGCIIRTSLLTILEEELRKNSTHILEISKIVEIIQENIEDLRKTVQSATSKGLPIHGLASSLHYFDGITQKRGSANFIQAMRDSFGAHTYKRTDKEGSFHSNWE